MPNEPKYHIILLPHQNYWSWVNAIREYAIRFQVTVTSRPDNALNFHRPDQAISIVDVQGAYPEYGNVVQWLKDQEPTVRLDVIAASSPDLLHQLLAERVNSGLRFGTPAVVEPLDPASVFKLLWPVDAKGATQGFGENPDVYRRWGLPGHEGIDFRAPLNANIYACADGLVYQVHDGTGAHPYGIHVRIRHADGYRTVYAHLNQALVHQGQFVNAGERIGFADSTGNSTGSHLHLTLKKDGATASGLTTYPYDILDPTPFLVYPDDREPVDLPVVAWPFGTCLVGLHGRADGPMQEADWSLVQSARIEALKLTSSASPEDVDRARSINPDMFVMVRLFADFRNRLVQAAEFARWVEHDMDRFYDKGVRYFELHNEPNLTPEGFGLSWRSGHDFGQWMLEAMAQLKAKFPEAKLGWPGLSPGPTVEGMRVDDRSFLNSAGDLIGQADWIACHCYWQSEDMMFSAEGGLGYHAYRERWPGKLLFITEFSNTAPGVDWQVKGNQYLKYYRHLRPHTGLGAAFSFVASASSNFPNEIWRYEDGRSTPIAAIVGRRSF